MLDHGLQGVSSFAEFDVFPAVGIIDNALHEVVVQAVAGAVGNNMAQNRAPQQGQITYQVQHLVANKFVVKAKTFFIKNRFTVPVDSDDILQAAAESETVSPKFFHLLDKPESSGLGQFIDEAFRGEFGAVALLAQEIVVTEFDGSADSEPVIGFNSDGFIAAGERDGLGDAEDFAESTLFFQTALAEQVNERAGTAVHDRYFV